MENQRVYGTSNMRVLLENEAISTEAFESLLAPGFHGSRSAIDFEGGHENRAGRPLYGSLGLEETRDFDEGLHQPEKKRRLSADQVHFLERSFELENKLEPERKAQLARDLGLEPRQVAIWFQNRRARWKTKQMEKDYETLKSSYDVLKADYDNLLMEKEKLQAEVLSLTNKLLLKEKNNGDSGSLESSKIPQVSQKIDSSCAADRKKSDAPAIVCKQEDLSSANSAVVDSESPYHTDEGGHSMLMEPDHSDLSHVGDVDDVKVCDFLRLEDNNSSNYEFPMEDPALWFWP